MVHHMMNNVESGNALVHCANLSVARGKWPRAHTVIHNVSFDLPEGSITGLLGPSGCGKTTLMRALIGVQKTSGGTITIAGLPAGSRKLRSAIGYTSQALSLYPDISVYENLRYFAGLYGLRGAKRDTRIAEVLQRVGLASHRDRPVQQLSGGQAGRVSLACALVVQPQLLVLDEPTVGLDPLTRQELWQLFRELADAGTPLLISSHVLDEAARCDSVLFMREGRLLAHDTIAELQATTHTNTPEEAFIALAGKEGEV
ncbi:ABC-type transport system, ATP-binding protein [Corynebacterium kroppenstedtii DSM 44385]|uniref:ABC-type transport system, ATP-binding protein n=2 Tax=Corynebacterium kroppenstedtii TaxID=161879 RepID=C4LK36_CORK4|nr:ABC-type transport system, ATP-binding protein [Corynebacterium kroppenstedtii DSM 44385]